MSSYHGLRGSTLEALVGMSLERYREEGLALIQKIPTPITPIDIDKTTRHITLAYFDQRSTVDYIGAVQGVPVCFDAKECSQDTFPLQNIHQHQVDFMREFEKQEGVAFILLMYSKRDECYYVPLRQILEYWDRAEKGGRKSFTYEELDKSFRILPKDGNPVPFLSMLQKDLDER